MNKSILMFTLFVLMVAFGVFINEIVEQQEAKRIDRRIVDIEMRFKRGQVLDIEIDGDRQSISLDDFILEVSP